MKKIIASLFLCFVAVNAFAMTAQEVFKKSQSASFFWDGITSSYIMEYETKSSLLRMRLVQIYDNLNKMKSR